MNILLAFINILYEKLILNNFDELFRNFKVSLVYESHIFDLLKFF
jgi:hypothetical protein